MAAVSGLRCPVCGAAFRGVTDCPRCKGKGEWNVYDVVCVDGVIKLAVNGKFVNGIRGSSQKKGYLCLESEGAEIHFRSIRIAVRHGHRRSGSSEGFGNTPTNSGPRPSYQRDTSV